MYMDSVCVTLSLVIPQIKTLSKWFLYFILLEQGPELYVHEFRNRGTVRYRCETSP